ncbi:MAG: saccharopine dehydrogenase NADP-binding domain-containing protein [Actinomycetota bacterium]|nr:saccharopine dehydrogenase NADP-binding domain-containing protein [Actinomycetota bacterium]
MRIAVLGAGMMGSAVARLLARHADVDLIVADVDETRARAAVDGAGRGKAITMGTDPAALRDLLDDVEAVASCVPYRRNLEVMEAALEAKCPYGDLGGLFHMTIQQLDLDDRFREAGVPAVAGAGCCPGLSNVLAKLAQPRFDQVETVDIIDGAIDEGGFGVPYSADTILDEFTVPAMIFEDGRLLEVPPGSGAIPYLFPEPLGEMEAVYTLHSEPATLPRTIPGVRNVRWRLALPPKVAEGFRLLIELGLASDQPVRTRSGSAVPRDVLTAVLDRLSRTEGPPRDVEILVVRVSGPRRGDPVVTTCQATFRPTPEGISAGAFGTASPMAVGARWLAAGRVAPGVHPPETAFEPEAFVDDLREEGVQIRIEEEAPV